MAAELTGQDKSRGRRRWAPPLLFALLFLSQAEAATDRQAAYDLSQAAVGRVVRDQVFVDAQGKTVRLSDFRGKPLVVSYIYTSCQHACPLITEQIEKAVSDVWDSLGKDAFHVASIGFDVRNDTPSRMAFFGRSRGLNHDGWALLAGDPSAVDGLAQDIGFTYARSSKGFDHLASATLIDAEGRVRTHIYGDTFDPPRLIEPLRVLIQGGIPAIQSLDDAITRFRLYCTVYDPTSGRYRFDYSIFIQIFAGATVLLAMGAFLIRSWLNIRRRSKC